MMDLNFFDSFAKDKKQKIKGEKSSVLPYLLAGLILIAIIGVTIYNMFSMITLKKSIESYERELNDPEVVAKLKEVEEKEMKIKTIEQERIFLEELEVSMKDIDSVTRSLMDLVASKVTNNLYLTNIDVNLKTISIEGNSLSKLEIAQFEYNLRASGKFDGIYVENISKEVGETPVPYFKFSMKFHATDKVYEQETTTSTVKPNSTKTSTPTPAPVKGGN